MDGVGLQDAQRVAVGQAVGLLEMRERVLAAAGQIFDDRQMILREGANAVGRRHFADDFAGFGEIAFGKMRVGKAQPRADFGRGVARHFLELLTGFRITAVAHGAHADDEMRNARGRRVLDQFFGVVRQRRR